MEHNFNPNKGDYKYILEEEQRKGDGKASAESDKPKKSKSVVQWLLHFMQTLFFQQSNERRKVNVSVSLFLQLLNQSHKIDF